jgi:cytochrome c oxidase cbb3-type subunit IV
MISETLQRIDGITIFPIIGMILFIVAFSACVVWVVRLDKRYVSHMEQLPLESDEETNQEVH